jgi:hypothetical protein
MQKNRTLSHLTITVFTSCDNKTRGCAIMNGTASCYVFQCCLFHNYFLAVDYVYAWSE